jgi:hypothetical protein
LQRVERSLHQFFSEFFPMKKAAHMGLEGKALASQLSGKGPSPCSG